MSRRPDRAPERSMGFPRVSGDEPAHLTDQLHNLRFSPRERG